MRPLKTALLAASALAVSGAALHAAAPAAPAPTELVAPSAIAPPPPAAHAAEEAGLPSLVKSAGLAALATAALAALYRLLGGEKAGRVLAQAGEASAKAALAVARAPVSAAKAAARAVGAPLRAVMLFAGLGVFALTGLWLFDLEWAGGLAAGAAGVAMVWAGSARGAKALAALKRRGTRNGESVNRD